MNIKQLLLISTIFTFQGFANDAGQQCDALAAFVGNPDSLADGFNYVEFEDIDSEKAIPICEQAIEENPTVLRYQFNLARAIDSSGDVVTAIKHYQQLVEKDYAVAKNHLGLKYYNGDGVEELDDIAYILFSEGCLQNTADACNALGDMYEGGYGAEQSDEKALKYYQKGAKLGSSAAYYNWANYQLQGKSGLKKSNSKAFKLFLKSAELGQSCAYGIVGQMYADGDGVEQSDEKAKFWFEKE